MSENKNQVTIDLLNQEIANYQTLYDGYLQILKATYPDRSEIDFAEDSYALKSLKDHLYRSERNLGYAIAHGHSYRYFGLTDSSFEVLQKRSTIHNPDTFLKAFRKMQNLYKRNYNWGIPQDIDEEHISKTNTIPLALWWYYFDKKTGQIYRSKERSYWLESFLIKPKFKAGDIVSIRGNVPDNAIKYEYDWGNGTSDLRTIYPDINFKAKTFMVLGEDNKKSNYYEKAYKPNANGGMRRYKLLPVGDTRVYWAIERALKINRTKAVKDAKKT